MLTLSSLSLGALLATLRAVYRASAKRDWKAVIILVSVSVIALAGSLPIMYYVINTGWKFTAIELIAMLVFMTCGAWTLIVIGDECGRSNTLNA